MDPRSSQCVFSFLVSLNKVLNPVHYQYVVEDENADSIGYFKLHTQKPVFRFKIKANVRKITVSHRHRIRGGQASCVLSSEPASWPHAWHGRCLNCSFRAHFRAGIPPSCFQLLLCAFMSLPLPISFSFIWILSLSVLSPSLFVSAAYPLLCFLI